MDKSPEATYSYAPEVIETADKYSFGYSYHLATPPPSNTSHKNFFAGVVAPEQEPGPIFYSFNTIIQVYPAVPVAKGDILDAEKNEGIFSVLVRNSKKKDSLYLTLAYSRFGLNSSVVCTETKFFKENLCVEHDNWEDRTASMVKSYWKYFGRLDCSTSIFSQCDFDLEKN